MRNQEQGIALVQSRQRLRAKERRCEELVLACDLDPGALQGGGRRRRRRRIWSSGYLRSDVGGFCSDRRGATLRHASKQAGEVDGVAPAESPRRKQTWIDGFHQRSFRRALTPCSRQSYGTQETSRCVVPDVAGIDCSLNVVLPEAYTDSPGAYGRPRAPVRLFASRCRRLGKRASQSRIRSVPPHASGATSASVSENVHCDRPGPRPCTAARRTRSRLAP